MIESKICKKCGNEKSSENFCKKSDNKDGLKNSCKECDKQYYINNKKHINNLSNKYYQESKEKISLKNKIIYDEHTNGIKRKLEIIRYFKICIKCKQHKSLKEFGKKIDSNDGHRARCLICVREDYQENKEKISERNKITYQKNKEDKRIKNKIWRESNPRKIKEYTKRNVLKVDIEKRRENDRIRNKNPIRKAQWRTAKTKIRTEKPYIIIWRKTLESVLSRIGKKKSGHTIDILGYSANDLKSHIESLFTPRMSWENYGEWHVDHIKPVSKFPLDVDIKIVNGLDNLRPMWATTREIDGIIYEGNLNKHNKYHE